ncbi:MAG: hypothetical protein R2713_11300 [Ilumatobacteraceae bacterium]
MRMGLSMMPEMPRGEGRGCSAPLRRAVAPARPYRTIAAPRRHPRRRCSSCAAVRARAILDTRSPTRIGASSPCSPPWW